MDSVEMLTECVNFLTIGGISTMGGGIAYLLWQRMRKPKLDCFFRACKLQVNDKYPHILKRKKLKDGKKVYGEEYKILMPVGMSASDIEKKKEALEQYQRGRADIWYDNNLFIRIDRRKLKAEYKYEPIKTDKPLEIAIAYSRNNIFKINLEKITHLLIAGATNGGKSVLLRVIITAFITTKSPDVMELNLTDFKKVELGIFEDCKMVKEFCATTSEFNDLLIKLKSESERRLELFKKAGREIVNISDYNKYQRKHNGKELKYIVNIVDEFAQLAEEKKEVMNELKRRAAFDRAEGIHYIVCTQRPSREIVDPIIKANMPGRICLQTASEADSKIVLDDVGAEKLRGYGNAIYKFGAAREEIQVMNLSTAEAISLVESTFVKKEKKPIKSERPGVIGNAYRTGPENNTLY